MDSLQLRNLVLAKMAKTEVETKFDNAYHDLALASLAASTDAVPANVVIVGPRATAEDYRKLLGIPANCPTQIRFVKHRDMSDSALPRYDLAGGDSWLSDRLQNAPVSSSPEFFKLLDDLQSERSNHPDIADDSVDLVVIDLAANELQTAAAAALLDDAYRVLRRRGMCAVLAYLADEPVTADTRVGSVELQSVPLEMQLEAVVARAKFYGAAFTFRADLPDRILASGTEVRLHALKAFKGKEGPCVDYGHAVMYRGPFLDATDDDGHVYRRGVRTAVCKKTYDILTSEPYAQFFYGIPCYMPPTENEAPIFDCNTPMVRDPKVTKGVLPAGGSQACCDPSTSCC